MVWALPLQWVGHASASHAQPPRCRPAAPGGSSLLWVDLSLAPGAPWARLLELRLPLPSGAAGARAPGRVGARSGLGLRVARLRRGEGGRTLRLKELSPPLEFEGHSEHAAWRGSGVGQPHVAHADLDLPFDAGAGDVFGLLLPCDGGAAVVSALAVGNSFEAAVGQERAGDGVRALSFTFHHEARPLAIGVELAMLDGDASSLPACAVGYRIEERVESVTRAGGALQTLSRVGEEAKCKGQSQLLENLGTLSWTCKWVRRYPMYVFHTARLEGIGIAELLAWTDQVRFATHPQQELRFMDVSEEFQRVHWGDSKVKLVDHDLLWMDLTDPRSRSIREGKPRRFSLGYRHMCRFHSSTILDLPALLGTRYLLHIDADATLMCRPGVEGPDPITEMADKGAYYGIFEAGVEDPAYTVGWAGFLEEYQLLHEIVPPMPLSVLSTSGAKLTRTDEEAQGRLVEVGAGPMSLTWGTAWEILDLDFFTSPRVLEFTHKVERSLGHYRHNWGDHLVRAYQVQLFAPISRVFCIDAEALPGAHGCGGLEREFGAQNVFQYLRDFACPGQWTAQVLPGVPLQEAGGGAATVPRACLQRCLETECQGFDFVYRQDASADCILRDAPATEAACAGGGVPGAVGAAWRALWGGEPRAEAVFVGAANRLELSERRLNRTFNCLRWGRDLAARYQAALRGE